MVGRQRTTVTVSDPVCERRVLGHLLAGGQMGGCGLPFELNLARTLDDVSNEQLRRGTDGGDDVGGDGLRQSVIDKLDRQRKRREIGENVRGGRAPSSAGPCAR
jgi:hypothetical protein